MIKRITGTHTISLESFRSFRGPLFRKPAAGQELIFLLIRTANWLQFKLVQQGIKQALRAYWLNIYTVIAGSAFIVPSSTLQKVEPPSIDKDGIQSNVSASIGRTAYLRCKVKNLGHKSVSFQILKKSIKNIGRFPTFPIKFLCLSGVSSLQCYVLRLRWRFEILVECFKNCQNCFNMQFRSILNVFCPNTYIQVVI